MLRKCVYNIIFLDYNKRYINSNFVILIAEGGVAVKRCYGCMREFDDEFDLCPHCGFVVGTMPEIKSHLPCGTKLSHGRYILGKVLGHGGFGITYIAWDTKRECAVAVKEFFPNAFSTRGEGETEVLCYNAKSETYFREGVRKMLDEAERLSRFYKNDNIVDVYDFFEANKTAYIVMEYLEGKDLKKHLEEKGGVLEIEEAIKIILPVLNALIDMHTEDLIHRDVSPDNIFICESGEVKLLDFGSARLAVRNADKSLSVMVKKGYAPKEQYASRSKQGPWTDVYAVCATLYEMITGEKPADSMERDLNPLKTFEELGVRGKGELENVIAKGLEPEVDNRTQNAQVLYAQLAEFLSAEELPKFTAESEMPKPDKEKNKEKKPKNNEKTSNSKSKKVFAVVAACITVLLVGFAAGKFLTEKRPEISKEETTTAGSQTVSEESTQTTEVQTTSVVLENTTVESDNLSLVEFINKIIGESQNIFIADVNGDGNGEIVVVGQNKAELYTALTSGGFSKTTVNGGENSEFLLDNAKKELVVVGRPQPDGKISPFAAKFSVSDSGFVLNGELFSQTEDATEFEKISENFELLYEDFIKDNSDFVDIKTLNVGGKCGDTAQWVYHSTEKLLRIFGTGVVKGTDSWENAQKQAKKAVIGDGITGIDQKAFSLFECLEYVGIGKSLSSLSSGALAVSCIAEINVDSENSKFESDANGVLFTKNKQELVQFPLSSNLAEYIVDGKTKSIAAGAFRNASKIKKVALPLGLNSMGKYAFSGCKSLCAISVPSGVLLIPEGAFADCTGLESVILENGVSEIGNSAFSGCSSLKAISLPESLKTIGQNAFAGCTGVSVLNIPTGVTSIGSGAFDGWKSSQTINIAIRQASKLQNGWNGKASLSYRFA